MRQEDKDLLLKDLCARLPYGVKVWYKYYPENVTEKFATSIRVADGKIALSSKFDREGDWHPVEEANELLIKPYLRPMSSMTEEQEKEEYEICKSYLIGYESKLIDFYHKNHFDYRGLIPMGLAIDATGLNIY